MRRFLLLASIVFLSIGAAQSAAGQNRHAWKRLCIGQGEQAYAGCVLRNGKRLAFCIPRGQSLPRTGGGMQRPAVSFMTYRIADRNGRVELMFPQRRAGSAARFRYMAESYARGARTVISFRRGTYRYRYEDALIAGPQGAGHDVTHEMVVSRNGQTLGRLKCRVQFAATPRPTGKRFVIVPGKRFGPITRRTTLSDLRRIYGRKNVWVGTIRLPHADFGDRRGAIVYRGTPREVKVVFKGRNRGPEHVVIDRRNSVWRTDRGLRIGLGLAGLERLIGGPFRITGFAQDGGGAINSQAAAVRNLYIRLQGDVGKYSSLMDQPFSSRHPDARRAGLKVSVIWWDVP